MTSKAQVSASFSFTQETSPDGGAAKDSRALDIVKSLAAGTADGQADLRWYDQRTLASNSNESLDLSGTLTDIFGNVISPAEICAVIIESDELNTTNLTVGNGTNPAQLWFGGTTMTEILKPGDFSLHYSKAGWAVTNSTADILKVVNATGASAVYRIGFLGRSS